MVFAQLPIPRFELLDTLLFASQRLALYRQLTVRLASYRAFQRRTALSPSSIDRHTFLTDHP